MNRPYRHTLRTAEPAEIRRLNVANGWEGARALEGTPETLTRIESTKQVSEARAHAWAHHPDELVQQAAMHAHRQRRPFGQTVLWDRLAPFTTVALQRADEEGALWTPALDSLASARALARQDGGGQHMAIAWARLERLIPWLQSQPQDEELRGLFDFTFYQVHALVAEHLPELSDSIAERLLDTPGGRSGLLGRPGRLSDALWDRLACRAAERVHRRPRTAGISAGSHLDLDLLYDMSRTGRTVPEDALSVLLDQVKHHERLPSSSSHSVGGLLLRLSIAENDLVSLIRTRPDLFASSDVPDLLAGSEEEPGIAQRSAAVRRALAQADYRIQFERALLELTNRCAAKDREFREALGRRRRLSHEVRASLVRASPVEERPGLTDPLIESTTRIPADRAHLSYHERVRWVTVSKHTPLPLGDLVRLYDHFESNSSLVAELIFNPGADVAFYVFVAEHDSRPNVRGALASSPEARRVPAVREILLDSRATEVIEGLSRDLREGEARSLFLQLLEKEPALAVQFLERMPPELEQRLRASDLRPLLMHRSATFRQAALAALGQAAPGPDETRRTRPTPSA